MTVKRNRRKSNRLPDPMRILVLMHEDLVPPESLDGLGDSQRLLVQTEFDVTTTLKKMRHEMLPLGVASDLGVLRDTLNEFQPKITFNLLEEFHGVAVYDQHVVSYLELMKRSYTGDKCLILNLLKRSIPNNNSTCCALRAGDSHSRRA